MATLRVVNLLNPDNIRKQPVPNRKLDKSKKITKWEDNGGNNDFPQVLLQTVYNSPVGSAAMDVWHEFISSSGFVNEELNNLRINKEQTVRQLEDALANDLALLDGIAIHVGYNANGIATEFHHMPFESCRLGQLNKHGFTDKIYFNPYYGIPQDYDKKFDKWFYTYNPDPEAVKKEMAEHMKLFKDKSVGFPYPGQIYWFSIEKPLARVYPQPFFNSSLNWMTIDSKIQQFHERNIDNNFLLSVIINVYGNPDDPAGGPEDLEGDNKSRDQVETQEEVFNRQLKSIAGGSENGGIALVNWYEKEDEKIDVEQFPTNANDELFDKLQTQTDDKIATGTKVPRVLVSLATGGKLGDTQEIINAIKVMQGRVKRKQMLLQEEMKKILKGYTGVSVDEDGKEIKFTVSASTDFVIPPHIPFDIIPDFVFEKLTDAEVREYIKENFNLDIDVEAELPAPDTVGEFVENAIKKAIKDGKHVHTDN